MRKAIRIRELRIAEENFLFRERNILSETFPVTLRVFCLKCYFLQI